MPNPTKVEKVKELKERLTGAEAAVFADYRGLTVPEAAELRSALAEIETQFAVVKNSLARLAVKEAKLDGLEAYIDGPTAIAFVKGDPVAAAKQLVEAAKKFPVLEVRGGFAEGRILTAEEIGSLAALESREVMLAKVAGLAKSQMARTAFMLQALQAKLLSLLEVYKEKVPGEPDEAAPGETPSADAPSGDEPTLAEDADEREAATGAEGGPAAEASEGEARQGEASEGGASEAGAAEGADDDQMHADTDESQTDKQEEGA